MCSCFLYWSFAVFFVFRGATPRLPQISQFFEDTVFHSLALLESLLFYFTSVRVCYRWYFWPRNDNKGCVFASLQLASFLMLEWFTAGEWKRNQCPNEQKLWKQNVKGGSGFLHSINCMSHLKNHQVDFNGSVTDRLNPVSPFGKFLQLMWNTFRHWKIELNEVGGRGWCRHTLCKRFRLSFKQNVMAAS